MTQRWTIIVTSERYGSADTDLETERALARQFPDIDVTVRGEPVTTEDALIDVAREADALLLSTRDAVTRRVCENIPRVQVIARYGVGLDNVDLDAATEHGIVITHYPQYCTNEVADHAVANLLTLNRRIAELDRDLHDGAWGAHGPYTRTILRGAVPAMREITIGVVGFGRIGSAVVRRLLPFGSRILVCDPYQDTARIADAGAESVSIDELAAASDMITLHCPLTHETRGLVDTALLSSMKPNVAIVNTSRGPVIDEAALIGFLESHPAARAALDVVEREPLALDSPLFQLGNVLLTPHSAYYSEASVETVRVQTFLSALAVLRGFEPPTIANPAVLATHSLMASSMS